MSTNENLMAVISKALADKRGEVSQDRIARRAQMAGLPWTRATVAAVENGYRRLTVEELLLVPFAYGCELGDLFPAEARVVITEDATLTGSACSMVVTGKALKVPSSDLDVPFVRDAPASAAKVMASLGKARHIGDRIGAALTEDEATTRAAERAGVTVEVLNRAAQRAWGRTYREELDARMRERLEPDASLRARRATQGHVGRELMKELLPLLKRK